MYTTGVEKDVGVARQKRDTTATTEESKAGEEMPHVRSKRFLSDLAGLTNMFPGMSMTLPGRRGSGQKEVSESAQMMKTLMLISKIQRRKAAQNVKRNTSGQQGYSGEKYNFGSGMYGDSYPGKRKRRSVITEAEANLVDGNVGSSSQPLSRKKRFLFGEPPDAPSTPPMPSFFSILMGTARDPNTGKKVEFGGDYMKHMMRRNFMAAMPHLGANTPPGKEPPDMVKNLAPLWYFSQVQRSMMPRPAPMMNRYHSYNTMHRDSPGSVKSKNRDGYYGDHFPMGKRKKRSADSVVNMESSDKPVGKRVKRQSEGNNDVITIGDLSIPTDFFKPPERSEEPKYYGGYKKPDDVRYYHQYSAPRQSYYYQTPRPSVYHQQQQYYQQQLQRQKQQQQQQQQKFLHHYRHLYSLYLQAIRAKQAPPTTNQWTPPAAPQVPYAPPPAQPPAPAHLPPAPAQAPPTPPQSPPPFNYAPPPPAYSHSPAAQAPPNDAFVNFAPHQSQTPMHQQGPLALPQSSHQYYGQSQSAYYPPSPPQMQSYPLDPFIPNPPLPPARVTTALPSRRKRSTNVGDMADLDSSSWGTELHRHKRSDDSDKDKRSYSNFYFPKTLFSPALFSPYFPPQHSVFSNKVGYQQPSGGGVIFGDRLPWTSAWKQWRPQARPVAPLVPVNRQPPPPPAAPLSGQSPPRPASPISGQLPPPPAAPLSSQLPPPPASIPPSPLTSGQPAPPPAPVNNQLPPFSAPVSGQPAPPSPFMSPSAPVNFQPLPAGMPAHRRVKRSDNNDNPDSSPNFLFGPQFFSPFLYPTQNHHNKIGFSTGMGGVVYGDQMPWARRAPPPPALRMSNPAAAPPPPPLRMSSPAAAPPPPALRMSSPPAAPPPPALRMYSPAAAPPPPALRMSSPAAAPPPPLRMVRPSSASSSFGGPLDHYASTQSRHWGSSRG